MSVFDNYKQQRPPVNKLDSLDAIKNEQKEIENIVAISNNTELDITTIEQIYRPLDTMLSAIPDPKDITVEPYKIKEPLRFEAAEPKKGLLEKFFGFQYPTKPPNWEYASPIEKFNFATLPISDILGRIGGKIATDWRMTTKENVQQTLASELSDDLKWYQKSPEAVGWTGEKIAEYVALKTIFKASGLHRVLTVAGQKAATPFMAKEITARGGLQAISTFSREGLKNLFKKSLETFLRAAPENVTFISSWSAFDAFMKDEDVKEAAMSGARWGLGLTAGFSVISSALQAPELKMTFEKAMAKIGQKFPKLLDKMGEPVTKEVEKEWINEISKSRGRDLRLIDLSKREREIFRNAIRAARREIIKGAETEAALREYWTSNVVQAKPPSPVVTVEQSVEKAETEIARTGDIALSDESLRKIVTSTKEFVQPAAAAQPETASGAPAEREKGIAAVPRFSAVKELYNRAHDWIFTFGQAKRESPELYDKLMSAYGKRNAGVEKAIDQISRIIPKSIELKDDVLLAQAYEDKRLSPPEELEAVYNKFANLLDELGKRQIEEGIFKKPFQERMIEENDIKINKLTTELKQPDKSKRIKALQAENESLRNMRYLPHDIVAKRAIESKVNSLKEAERQAFFTKLSAFYKKRTGKLFLKDYLESGLITQEDMRLSRLATEELADYYTRATYKSLYDYAKESGYIKPTSKGLRAEGWLNQKELGITSLELKNKLVHPLFGSALAEMKAMRKGRGSFISQVFGMTKIGQFLKPTVIWTYNAVQKYMRGMYSLNPVTEAKALTRAAQSVLGKDELYHKLNESNLFQFPYEVSRGAREEEINKFINQHSAEIDKITKLIEKTTDTSWISPDMTAGKLIKNIIMAAHRAIGQATWAGDKIQRTQSYLVLRDMGYNHEEAVKVASSSHGGYSLLSERYKGYMSNKLFVYSFRYLMPREMLKTITEPLIAAKDVFVGKEVPKHKWNRMVKAVVGSAFIPIAIDEYMKRRGFEKEGEHLGPLAWKWSKTVVIDGKKREIVVGVNDILNMPVKYWNRMTRYNPIRPETRAQQAFENLLKWELHPLYRIFFWDINENRRSFGTGTEVYDKNANPVIQIGQTAKYIFGQSFRFWGGMMDAVGEGSMTEKERKEQEKIFDSALSGLDKFLFTALGYVYTRQPVEERKAIMIKSLEKELTSRQFEIARKYEGEELEKRVEGLKKWAKKCEDWIKNME